MVRDPDGCAIEYAMGMVLANRAIAPALGNPKKAKAIQQQSNHEPEAHKGQQFTSAIHGTAAKHGLGHENKEGCREDRPRAESECQVHAIGDAPSKQTAGTIRDEYARKQAEL